MFAALVAFLMFDAFGFDLQKSNTKHDPPYWRGAIWINMNFLAVRALRHYSLAQGPFQELAAQIHTQLRDNVVQNMFKQFQASRFVWEQYEDGSGRGKGSHPFTGWSALVVLLMADN
eukprot:m.545442 g.545442  ORF g.545442 m.545442 type:complete len:117 (+) comp57671_c0_seq3:44-394(+)